MDDAALSFLVLLSFSMNSKKVDSKKTVIISLDDENKTKNFERNNLEFTSVVVDSAFVYPFPIKVSKKEN